MALSLNKILKEIGRPGKAAAKSVVNWTPKNEDCLFLLSSMIPPEDAILSTASAKTYYKAFMKHIDFFKNNDERALHADIFYEKLVSEEESIIKIYHGNIRELRNIEKKTQEYRKKLSKLKDRNIIDKITKEIKFLEYSAKQFEKNIQYQKEKYDNFIYGKRWFLIDYVNTEIHGCDWKEKYYKMHYSKIL